MISWVFLFEIIYVAIVVIVCMRIIYDTRSYSKTLAYLLFVVLIPFLGIVFYFSVGVNYRKRKIYNKKLFNDDGIEKEIQLRITELSRETFLNAGKSMEHYQKLAYMITHDGKSVLTDNNSAQLLINGEQKFPKVLEILNQAKSHIHIEYYIFEDDEIGHAIEEILVRKVKEGVDVRLIYDDFGSRSIRKKMIPRLREAGVKAYPFYKITFIRLANRINYRNHRKIIVVDGCKAFVGGINISDKYINNPSDPAAKTYWRDTHLYLEGSSVYFLQYLFLGDWNFAAKDDLYPNGDYFPPISSFPKSDDKIVQIVGSGPDSETPTILYSLVQTINLAKEELLITSPYFIPGESIKDALAIAALGGVHVKLLLPGISDSKLVNAAAFSYYKELLNVGVEIYLYEKGFVHAKTLVADGNISIVGTANMDYRSFDLNFEVNAIVYDQEIAQELRVAFFNDLKGAKQINVVEWNNRSKLKQFMERLARLLSPLL